MLKCSTNFAVLSQHFDSTQGSVILKPSFYLTVTNDSTLQHFRPNRKVWLSPTWPALIIKLNSRLVAQSVIESVFALEFNSLPGERHYTRKNGLKVHGWSRYEAWPTVVHSSRTSKDITSITNQPNKISIVRQNSFCSCYISNIPVLLSSFTHLFSSYLRIIVNSCSIATKIPYWRSIHSKHWRR